MFLIKLAFAGIIVGFLILLFAMLASGLVIQKLEKKRRKEDERHSELRHIE